MDLILIILIAASVTITFENANAICKHHIILDNPIEWCRKNLHKYTNAKGPKEFCDEYNFDVSEYPVEIIEEFVFDISQVQYEPAPKRKETNIYERKKPPKRGDEYSISNSSLEYFQQDSQQYEHTAYDSNQQLSVYSTPVYQDEYPSFDDKQEGTSTSYMGSNFLFDLNKSPPRD